MSRALKFRAWNKEEKEYRHDLNIALTLEGELYAVWAYHPQKITSNIYIIEQYTGLKDKNGKKIYEGDIVKTNSPDQPNFKVGVIEFVQQAFWISNAPSNRPDHTHSELLLQYWETEIEVIGNIHENPELLEAR